jgi:hypothetical protein
MSGATRFNGSRVRQFGRSGVQPYRGAFAIEPPHRSTGEPFSPETRADFAAVRPWRA